MKQKIVIRNLGPIKHADIDIKPLTVLIGENVIQGLWQRYWQVLRKGSIFY